MEPTEAYLEASRIMLQLQWGHEVTIEYKHTTHTFTRDAANMDTFHHNIGLSRLGTFSATGIQGRMYALILKGGKVVKPQEGLQAI